VRDALIKARRVQPAMRPVVDRVLDDEEEGDLADDGRPRGKRDVIGSQTEITHKRVEAGDLQVGSRSVTVGGGGLSDGLDGLNSEDARAEAVGNRCEVSADACFWAMPAGTDLDCEVAPEHVLRDAPLLGRCRNFAL
jgi:hypothetical protein